MRVKILIAVLPTLLTACGVLSRPEIKADALVIASCPELGAVTLVTPADSWRALVNDAEQYNKCRCAALRNTTEACPEPTK